jgi:CDP-diacylglycerol--glycerol-3-phosphate 3-phosphatidyltransferase
MHVVFRNVPNGLSLSRIPLAAVFLIVFCPTIERRFWWSIAILGLATLTDFLDGLTARKYGLSSRTGYFLDGIGDKAVYAAVLLVIFREEREQSLLPWLLIIREIILYALRALEGGTEKSLRSLRSLSLFYAGFIRLYFLGFFLQVACSLYDLDCPVMRWYFLFGYAAAVCGALYIFRLAKRMGQSA